MRTLVFACCPPPPPPEKSRYQKYLTKKKSPQSVLGPKCTNFKPHAKRSYIPVITNTPPSTPPPLQRIVANLHFNCSFSPANNYANEKLHQTRYK